MTKNFAIIIVVAIILFGGIVWLSYPEDGEKSPTEIERPSGFVALAAEHNEFDFGNISMAKGKVEHTFKIRNNSGKDIDITKLFTSCMCTTAEIKTNNKVIGPYGMPGHGGSVPNIKEMFKAGEEAEVKVVFDPAAHGPAGIGKISRLVVIENNGGDPLQVVISANVTP